MIKKNVYLLALSCVAILSHAQITIGIHKPPHPGAILELKNLEEASPGDVNATKGLGLPRVALTSVNFLNPLVPLNDDSKNEEHTGAVVYNTSRCSNMIWTDNKEPKTLHEGLNVWMGDEWINPSKNNSTTTREEDGFKIPNWFDEGVGAVKDIDGNIYTTMDYGAAGIWMTESLRAKTYDTESPMSGYSFKNNPPSASKNTPSSFQPMYSYTGPAGSNGLDSKYYDVDNSIGLFYNVDAVFGTHSYPNTTEGVQGLCPNGWYVPTMAEYRLLLSTIVANYQKYALNQTTKEGYYLLANCYLDSEVRAPYGESKPTYNSGFEFKCYGLMHGDEIIAYDYQQGVTGFPMLWIVGVQPGASHQGLAMIDINSGALLVTRLFYQNSQAPLRCKKK